MTETMNSFVAITTPVETPDAVTHSNTAYNKCKLFKIVKTGKYSKLVDQENNNMLSKVTPQDSNATDFFPVSIQIIHEYIHNALFFLGRNFQGNFKCMSYAFMDGVCFYGLFATSDCSG